MASTILSTLIQSSEAGDFLGSVSPTPVEARGISGGLPSRVEEVSLRSLSREIPEESFVTLMARVSLGQQEERFRSVCRAAEPIFRKKNSADSPVDAAIREEIGTYLSLYGQGSSRLLEQAFSERQFHRAVSGIVWEKISPRFLSLALPIFESKFTEIFSPNISLLRKLCITTLETEIQKEADAFLKGSLERQSDFRNWVQYKEDFLRVICERQGDLQPSWIIDSIQIRNKAGIIFNEVLQKYRIQGLSLLKKTAEHWIRNYYEESFLCWNEEQEEVIPDFLLYLSVCRRAIRGCLVEDFLVRETLKTLYEKALDQRPSDYLIWLIERKYSECNQMPDAQVIAMCEANFCRRFLVAVSPECHNGIVSQYKRIKEERIKRLHIDLRHVIEMYITREVPLQIAAPRKNLGQVINTLLQERFSDAPLSESQIMDFIFHTYIEVMVNEKNLEFGLSCVARIPYPFIFPDKKEPLHQRLYAELLTSIELHMAQDFIPCNFFPPGELPDRIKKVAHDALNNCIRNIARNKISV